jgi:hypothetical protein
MLSTIYGHILILYTTLVPDMGSFGAAEERDRVDRQMFDDATSQVYSTLLVNFIGYTVRY